MIQIAKKIQQKLQGIGIKQLNAMQMDVLGAAFQDKNLVLLSPTGSGKTLAFALPLMGKIDAANRSVQALIIVPTRELVLQIEQVFRQINTDFKINVCYGGHQMRIEKNNLKHAPHILVGTPGRLADHLRRGHLDLSATSYLVLDEFDKSLELGFQKEMEFILSEMHQVTHRVLTSATTLKSYPEFLQMPDHKLIDYLVEEEEEEVRLEKRFIRAEGKDKLSMLFELLCYCGESSSLVFCNHRDAVERISELLHIKGVHHDIFHGGLQQEERERALLKFRNGSVNILITTDLASRGLDIPEIENVIHYQLPTSEEIFVHRNGRTARMKASGKSYLLFSATDEPRDFLQEDLMELQLSEISGHPLPPFPKYVTVYIGGGKKDKINKIDILGFFCKQHSFQKDDIGMIEVKDHTSYLALKRSANTHKINKLGREKIKKTKVKIAFSR